MMFSKKNDIDVKILTSLSFPRGQNFVSKPRGKNVFQKNIVRMDFDRSKSTTIENVLMFIIKVFQNDIVGIPILRCQNASDINIFEESVPNFLRLKTSLEIRNTF